MCLQINLLTGFGLAYEVFLMTVIKNYKQIICKNNVAKFLKICIVLAVIRKVVSCVSLFKTKEISCMKIP